MQEAKLKELFGLRIKEIRKNKKYSQELLAEKTDITAKYLSRIEMGHHFPTMNTLNKFSKVLKVEIKDFFEFAHKEESEKKLKDNLKSLFNEADGDKLVLLIKIARAILK